MFQDVQLINAVSFVLFVAGFSYSASRIVKLCRSIGVSGLGFAVAFSVLLFLIWYASLLTVVFGSTLIVVCAILQSIVCILLQRLAVAPSVERSSAVFGEKSHKFRFFSKYIYLFTIPFLVPYFFEYVKSTDSIFDSWDAVANFHYWAIKLTEPEFPVLNDKWGDGSYLYPLLPSAVFASLYSAFGTSDVQSLAKQVASFITFLSFYAFIRPFDDDFPSKVRSAVALILILLILPDFVWGIDYYFEGTADQFCLLGACVSISLIEASRSISLKERPLSLFLWICALSLAFVANTKQVGFVISVSSFALILLNIASRLGGFKIAIKHLVRFRYLAPLLFFILGSSHWYLFKTFHHYIGLDVAQTKGYQSISLPEALERVYGESVFSMVLSFACFFSKIGRRVFALILVPIFYLWFTKASYDSRALIPLVPFYCYYGIDGWVSLKSKVRGSNDSVGFAVNVLGIAFLIFIATEQFKFSPLGFDAVNWGAFLSSFSVLILTWTLLRNSIRVEWSSTKVASFTVTAGVILGVVLFLNQHIYLDSYSRKIETTVGNSKVLKEVREIYTSRNSEDRNILLTNYQYAYFFPGLYPPYTYSNNCMSSEEQELVKKGSVLIVLYANYCKDSKKDENNYLVKEYAFQRKELGDGFVAYIAPRNTPPHLIEFPRAAKEGAEL